MNNNVEILIKVAKCKQKSILINNKMKYSDRIIFKKTNKSWKMKLRY